MKRFTVVLLIVASTALAQTKTEEKKPDAALVAQVTKMAQDERERMKDPGSFIVEAALVTYEGYEYPAIDLAFRSKNSYGGYERDLIIWFVTGKGKPLSWHESEKLHECILVPRGTGDFYCDTIWKMAEKQRNLYESHRKLDFFYAEVTKQVREALKETE